MPQQLILTCLGSGGGSEGGSPRPLHCNARKRSTAKEFEAEEYSQLHSIPFNQKTNENLLSFGEKYHLQENF